MIFSSSFLIQLWYLLVSALKWCLCGRHQQKRFCKGGLLHVLTGSVGNVLWEGGYFLTAVVAFTSASSLAGRTPQWMFLEGFVVLYFMYFLFYQDIWIRTYLLTSFPKQKKNKKTNTNKYFFSLSLSLIKISFARYKYLNDA